MPRYQDDDDNRSRKKSKRGSQADSSSLTQAGSIVVGFFVLAILVYGASSLFSSKPLLAPPVAEQSPIVAGPMTAVATVPEDRTNKVHSERERVKPVESQKETLQKKYGADRLATVVIKNVGNDSTLLNQYLNRKLFRAVYKEYKDHTAGEPVSDQTMVGALFDSDFVRSRYKQLKSDLPYPQILSGTKAKGSLTYYAIPVDDLSKFAVEIGLGDTPTVDSETRTVTIEAELPSPIPDLDADELGLQYGNDAVAKIRVNGARGPVDNVRYYLEWQTALVEASGELAITGVKMPGADRFEFFVAPVKDLPAFGSRITYGTVANIDPKSRMITIDANLPAELPRRPSDVELVEIRRRELDRVQSQPAAEKPRPGEDFYIWAIRSLKSGQPGPMKSALSDLAKKEVDETRRREVADTLIATLKGSSHIPDHLNAMVVWKTEGTDRAMIGLIGNPLHRQHLPAIMAALAKMRTKEAARSVSMAFADDTYGEVASRSLIEMGSVAEEFMFKFIDHRDEYVRTRAYGVLFEIGTDKALPKLRSSLTKEKDTFLKNRVKEVIEKIKQRSEDAKASTESDAPPVSKPSK